MMDEVKAFNYFGAIPGRATGDDNLSGLHFQVLMVIAGHDRVLQANTIIFCTARFLADFWSLVNEFFRPLMRIKAFANNNWPVGRTTPTV